MVHVSESGMFESRECGDCGRVYLVEDAAGENTVCPICQSPASEFIGLYEVKKVEQTTTAAGAGNTSGGR